MTCPHCNGSGWITVERYGYSGAVRCVCQPQRAPRLKRMRKLQAPADRKQAAAGER